MATFSAVTRQHILAAMAEYDERGGAGFLGVYGFEPSTGLWLISEGRRYEPMAILGVAHRYATGRLATADEFHGGNAGAMDLLLKRGFEVSGATHAPGRAAGATAGKADAEGTTSVRAESTSRRPAAGTRRRAAATERPVAICPTCFTTLPATGVCDNCG
ncbi:MAG: hypothetical protein FWF28_09220 [Micrococcales bacterium]|nr:hypothetical protein [Micrococcales bacterium]